MRRKNRKSDATEAVEPAKKVVCGGTPDGPISGLEGRRATAVRLVVCIHGYEQQLRTRGQSPPAAVNEWTLHTSLSGGSSGSYVQLSPRWPQQQQQQQGHDAALGALRPPGQGRQDGNGQSRLSGERRTHLTPPGGSGATTGQPQAAPACAKSRACAAAWQPTTWSTASVLAALVASPHECAHGFGYDAGHGIRLAQLLERVGVHCTSVGKASQAADNELAAAPGTCSDSSTSHHLLKPLTKTPILCPVRLDSSTPLSTRRSPVPLCRRALPLVRSCSLDSIQQQQQRGSPCWVKLNRRISPLPPESAFDVACSAGADVFAVKIEQSGGLFAAQRVAAIADAAGIAVYGGTMLEGAVGTIAAAHLFSTFQHLQWGTELFGPLLLAEEILVQPLGYHDFHLDVPTAPGLGIELDEDRISAFRRDAKRASVTVISSAAGA
ncbi:MAG: hypothetical protein WDW38_004721 [Sanguina aurantia]